MRDEQLSLYTEHKSTSRYLQTEPCLVARYTQSLVCIVVLVSSYPYQIAQSLASSREASMDAKVCDSHSKEGMAIMHRKKRKKERKKSSVVFTTDEFCIKHSLEKIQKIITCHSSEYNKTQCQLIFLIARIFPLSYYCTLPQIQLTG